MEIDQKHPDRAHLCEPCCCGGNGPELIRPPLAAHGAAIVERARLRLELSPYPTLQRLDCDYHEGVLTVRGRVSTFYERQLAWITLCDLEGLEEFVDRIDVVEPVCMPRADTQRAAPRHVGPDACRPDYPPKTISSKPSGLENVVSTISGAD